MVELNQKVEHGNPTLDGIISLTISTTDDVLKDKIVAPLQDPRILPFKFEPSYTDLSSLMRADVAQPSNGYLIDFLNLPSEDYPKMLEKIKQIRAINVESKVAVLATEAQQSHENFGLFRWANGRGLVGLYTRPDPNVSPEPSYTTSVEGMSSELPRFLIGLYQTRNATSKLENVEIVKIGGSIFDLYGQDPAALRNLLAAIVDIHGKHDLILTVGGGPLMEVPASYKAAFQMSDKMYQEAAKTQITQQALLVVDLLEQIVGAEQPAKVAYLGPEFLLYALKFNMITRDFLEGTIPVLSYLPEQSREIGIPQIPFDASDAHTVAVADRLGSRKIIFAKNTDGVYFRDPNLPRSFWQHLRPPFRGNQNQLLDFIYANEIADRIERMGLNQRGQLTGEHLIETRAIQPFMDSTSLYTIQIVNGTKPQQLADAMNGLKVGSYIIK